MHKIFSYLGFGGGEKVLDVTPADDLANPVKKSQFLLGVELLVRELHYQRKVEQRSRRRKLALLLFVVTIGIFFFRGLSIPKEEIEVAQKPFLSIPLAGKKDVAYVAVIPIDGDISGDDFGPPGFDNTTLYIRTVLELALQQKNLAAVVFNITSNGGDAVASAQGHRLIKKFRDVSKIPVTAYISAHAYSGGYYLALGADEIVIDPEAQVGSVGVIISYPNAAALGKVLGIGSVDIVTGPLKSCIGQWKELTPACRMMYQRSVDLTFKRFLTAMSESRGIPLETLLAESSTDGGRTNGGIFVAEDAIANKMADRSMSKEEFYASLAASIAKKYPAYKGVEFVRYDKKLGVLTEWKKDGKKTIESATKLMNALTDSLNTRAQLRAE